MSKIEVFFEDLIKWRSRSRAGDEAQGILGSFDLNGLSAHRGYPPGEGG
jgi:hypothetical protein